MSLENVQNVIGLATVDRAFRDKLFSNPDEALKGHDLTPEEVSCLKALSREKFDAVSGELEEQILATAVGGSSQLPAVQLNAEQLQVIKRFDLGRFGQYANTN